MKLGRFFPGGQNRTQSPATPYESMVSMWEMEIQGREEDPTLYAAGDERMEAYGAALGLGEQAISAAFLEAKQNRNKAEQAEQN